MMNEQHHEQRGSGRTDPKQRDRWQETIPPRGHTRPSQDDRERRLQRPDPKSQAARRMELAVPHTSTRRVEGERTVVEHSTPLWRLVGVIAAFGAIGAAGYYLNVVGRIDDAATILVITIVYTVTFWAHRQPARLEARLGPFGRIGRAISDSQQDITQWVNDRTLLAGMLIALAYGVAVVIGKHVIAAILSSLYSPWLAVAIGLATGAAVVSPELWRDWHRRIARGSVGRWSA